MKTLFLSLPRKLIVAFALTIAALAFTACAPDSASPTTAPSITAPTVNALATAPDSLHALKNAEKERIAAEAVRSVPVYDSLHAAWAAAHLRQKGKGSTTTTATAILDCEPLPYAADVHIVGPEGATFFVGPHRFYIPKGALTEETVITVEAPVTRHAELKFSPHGLTFGTSYLLLDYHGCDLGTSRKRNVVYTDDSYSILATQPSYDQKNSFSVWASIEHFSSYVVAY